MNHKWKKELLIFFDIRSSEIIKEKISLEKLCYISGRDPRIWTDKQMYDDLIQSIKQQLDLKANHTLLEIGCAAGFLALGLSPIVKSYVGVDISNNALKVASKLGLKNATFKKADGSLLPFSDNFFDRVLSYDVFTNFPSIEYVKQVVKEMVRVVKPGGKIMVGSLADIELKEEYLKLVEEISKKLDLEKGKLKFSYNLKILDKIRLFFLKKVYKITPQIICYYFKKKDFIEIGRQLKLETKIYNIHKLNPYYGYRFNVVYTKRFDNEN